MTSVNTPTYQNKYVVLAIVSTPYLFSLLHRTCFREYVVLKFVLAHTYLQTLAVVCTDFAEVCRLGGASIVFFLLYQVLESEQRSYKKPCRVADYVVSLQARVCCIGRTEAML